MKLEKRKVVYAVTVIAAILMMATIALPFASANKEARSCMLSYPDFESVQGMGLTNKDLTDVSLFEYGRAYLFAAQNDIQVEMSITCLIIISIFAILNLLTLLFSLLKKPIAVIVFDILTLISFAIIRFDFSDRGVVPSGTYNWGIVNYFVFIAGIVIFAGAVIMCVMKRKSVN